VIDNIVELLEPILIATELLSSSSYSTISDICLTFLGLYHHLSKFIDNKSQITEQYIMADSIRFKLNKYWFILEESTIITILDPSSKLLTFPTNNEKDTALTSLKNTITQYNIPATTTTTTMPKLMPKNKRKFFKLLLIQQQTIKQLLMEEL
ncbi:859_t:CDS:1, partial [Dentiscutata erythropus]